MGVIRFNSSQVVNITQRLKALFLVPSKRSYTGRLAAAALTVPITLAPLSVIMTSRALAAPPPSWQLTGSLSSAHSLGGSTLLQNGEALVVSGIQGDGSINPTAELYNPATGQWTPTGSVNQPRAAFYSAITLNNGDAFIAGGSDNTASTDYASAELYNPTTGQWTYTGSLNTPRRYPVVVKLADGRVLVATGAHGVPDGNRFLFSAEVYDPSTGQFSGTGAVPLARDNGNGILLQNGNVLVFGGEGPWLVNSPQTELYNPTTNSWSLTGDMPQGVEQPAVTLMANGKVLVAGGSSNGTPATSGVAIYDSTSGTWSQAAPMHYSRISARAVTLPSGDVLVTGGTDASGNPVLTSELYDPTTNTWTDSAPMNGDHSGGQIFLLGNGSVLMAAGGASSTAELYGAPATPSSPYDSLGDSYSSGDGAPPYTDQTCKVSTQSFAVQLQFNYPDLNLNPLSNWACSGATSQQVISHQISGLAGDNQVNPVKVVTITAGGDNIDFAGVLTNCYTGVGLTLLLNTSQLVKDTLTNALCKTAQQTQLNAKIKQLQSQLVPLYNAIHTAAPQARILVVGYPNIFPQNPAGSCDLLPQASVAWLSQEALSLDNAIKASVTAANVAGGTGNKAEFVDSSTIFQNNTVCSATPWVNPISLQTFQDFAAAVKAHGPQSFGQYLNELPNTPFHPNAAGYAAWASAIHTYLVSHP